MYEGKWVGGGVGEGVRRREDQIWVDVWRETRGWKGKSRGEKGGLSLGVYPAEWG